MRSRSDLPPTRWLPSEDAQLRGKRASRESGATGAIAESGGEWWKT